MRAARRKPAPGAPKSLRVSGGFRDFVMDQLSNVRQLRPQPMFGAIGLYAGEQFFGILAADVLYLKVDDRTRGQYEAAGATAFRPFPGRPMSMGYYSVPPAILEDPDALAAWVSQSLAAARTTTKRRPPKAPVKHRRGSRR